MMDKKREQWLAAARTVRSRQVLRRRALVRQAPRLCYDARIAAAVYYLSLGAVPQSLWSNG